MTEAPKRMRAFPSGPDDEWTGGSGTWVDETISCIDDYAAVAYVRGDIADATRAALVRLVGVIENWEGKHDLYDPKRAGAMYQALVAIAMTEPIKLEE